MPTLRIGESVKGQVDTLALGALEPARERSTLISQRDERAPGIGRIAFTFQQPQCNAL